MTKLTSSPWGAVQHQRELAPGIIKVSTASHGGIWLSPERYAQMPEKMRDTGFSKGGWYEEDCDVALVAVIFPEAFTAEQQAAARASISRYYPELVDAIPVVTLREW